MSGMGRIAPSRLGFGAILAIIALIGAYRAFDDARYAYLGGSAPQAALRLRPADAIGLMADFDRRSAENGDVPITSDQAERLRQSLARSALDPRALRGLALEAAGRNDAKTMQRAMILADAVSRRDATTQLLLVEYAVERGDVPGAVAHYHRAMAVHPELEKVLLPILAQAISGADVRAAIAPYIALPAPWSLAMLNAGLASASAKDVALLVLPVANSVGTKQFQDTIARLLSKLAFDGEFAIATQLAKAIWPELDASAFTVTDATSDPRFGSLSWVFASDGAVVASANSTGGFDVTINAFGSSTVASRAVAVQPGASYVFSHDLKGSGDASPVEMKWQAFCLPGAKQLIWEQKLPADAARGFASVLVIPSSCKGVLLNLMASGSDQAGKPVFNFENLRLTRR